jgi:DNA adenine methylase
MIQTKPLPPILRWAGGKRRIADKIATMYEPRRYRRLVEPFCGGLSIALGLQPDRALLNDINFDLINFYEWLQSEQKYWVIKASGYTGFFEIDMSNTEENYYKNRDTFNLDNCSDWHRAQYFYYFNLTGFNGLCRYNKKGGFNVPYGKRKSINIPSCFGDYEDAMKGWSFKDGDYRDLAINQDDFLFVDPPYDSETNKGFVSYSGNEFGWQQQIELVDWLDLVPKVPQIACNAATDQVIKLYTDRGWNVEINDMHTSISCDGNRTPRKEILATRYL